MTIRTDLKQRTLRDVMGDFEFRGKPVSQAMAEEAVRAVAADGVVKQGEVDALEPYGDGVRDLLGWNKTDRSTWKEGSVAGRALFNSLSDTIERLHFQENRETLTARRNPFMWFAPVTKDVPVTADALMREVRQSAMGWIDNAARRIIADFPKATKYRNTYYSDIKPDVKAAITRIKKDWMAGKVVDETNLAAGLLPLLERKYR